MIPNLDGASQQFLADLDRLQAGTERAQREISSGLRVQDASDAPDEIRRILQLRAEIERSTQLQTNLGIAKADAESADNAVQTAVNLVNRAITLATQGSGSLPSATQRAAMSQEVSGLLEQLVGLSRTNVAGRFIFSGDHAQVPAYDLNPANPNGVNRLITSGSTRQIQDVSGLSFQAGMTAQDIFDHRNPNDTLAADNVFAAVNALQVALANNDQAATEAAGQSLEQAAGHLNAVLGFYGTTQNRILDALERASKIQVQQKTDLSREQDADLPAASLELSLDQTHQQAALSARAKLPKTSLFDFLA